MANLENDNNQVKYFAAKSAEETSSILLQKAESFFNNLVRNRYLDKLRIMWKAYHGVFIDGAEHEISFIGEQGELTSVPVNHFRNLAKHIYTMITATRPIMEARAINTDYKSLAQANLANGILDYYMREKHLEEVLKEAVEMAIFMGSGFVKLEWNSTAGEAYDYDEESDTFNYEGEIEFSTLSPFDVVVDGSKDRWKHEWVLVRTYQNRFNLMAKYPELRDKIQGLPSKSDLYKYRFNLMTNDETDDIPVYEFYHKKTEAMPDGRYLLFLDESIPLIDMALPYHDIPIYRVAAGNIVGTPYGYTDMFDIYPLQEVINSLYSILATNQSTFGVTNVFIPEDANLSHEQLEGGLNVVKGRVKPEPLNLTNTPQEIYKSIDLFTQTIETLSGVSSVTRGQPEASLRTGTALALVQSMTLQYSSGLQQNYVKLIEDVGTGVINILKRYSNTPKLIALVGRNNRTELKEFTGDQIKDVNRIVVDMGNPLSRCLAKDTPVLMYDGTTKMVQDIRIGDQIMGPDSSPRTVGNVNSGEEMMYEITSKDLNRAIKYGCNESHILTLKYCSDDYRYDSHKGDILDITVKDYLKLPERHKRLLQGFTTGVEFEKKNLTIPPYILGSWLGDGTSRNTSITTMDKEIVDEWSNYAKEIGMTIRVQENRQPNKSKVYFITSGESHGKSDRNSFMNELRAMELIQNKHIPFIYLTSSREDRLNLLAGLIDTDGHRIDETFIFTQKNEKLVNDVIYLAKSLGFRVTSKKIKSASSKLVGEIDSEIFKVSIGGDTWEIPVRLPRKKAQKKEKARNPLNYGINIECKGFGTYYGFTLIEEPHFLLGDFTVTHNTIAGRAEMASELLQMGMFKTPEQYLQVVKTGNLDVTYEGTISQLNLIKKENEMMLNGKKPRALMTDQHSMHISEHQSVLADPELRENGELVDNVLAHIQEHIEYLRTTDPGLLGMIKEQPLPPVPGMPTPPVPGQEPTKESLQSSPIPEIMSPNTGEIQAGETISGPGVENVGVPNLPTPPAPFNNLPVTAQELNQPLPS